MVKPINSQAPQSTPTKTGEARGVSQEQNLPNVGSNQNNEMPGKPVPLYNEKARTARRAEHSMSGEAWALKLQQQLDAKNQSPKSSSMIPPRMGWEVNVNHSDSNPVPTPYPNIADAKKKDK